MSAVRRWARWPADARTPAQPTRSDNAKQQPETYDWLENTDPGAGAGRVGPAARSGDESSGVSGGRQNPHEGTSWQNGSAHQRQVHQPAERHRSLDISSNRAQDRAQAGTLESPRRGTPRANVEEIPDEDLFYEDRTGEALGANVGVTEKENGRAGRRAYAATLPEGARAVRGGDGSPFLKLPRAKAKSKFRTKACLGVETQNMRGRSHAGSDLSKWKELSEEMFLNRIGVLAVQETHLDEKAIAKLQARYKDIRIMCSPDPENPTGRGGVGVVLNRKLVRTENARFWTIVPGRAVVVSFDWHRDQRLAILAVYAPNGHEENKSFWTRLMDSIRERADVPKPQVMLGDFNMVESAADRYPAHLLPADMTAEFQELLSTLGMLDGWREAHPRQFYQTWRDAGATTMARLDRIYVTKNLFSASRKWVIDSSRSWCSGTDHLPVRAELVNPAMPLVGPGRWTMTLAHLRNKHFMGATTARGRELQERVDGLSDAPRDPDHNIQHLWAQFKREVAADARRYAREQGQKNSRILLSLEAERAKVQQAAAEGEMDRESFQFELLSLDERIQHVSKKQAKRRRQRARAKASFYDETNSAQWFQKGRPQRNADVIPFLFRPESRETGGERPERECVTRTEEMVELARDHHNDLQDQDVHDSVAEREAALEEVLASVSRVAHGADLHGLENLITDAAIRAVVSTAPNGKAAGVDGLIYELWKELDAEHRKAAAAGFNVVGIMTAVFADIQQHGLASGSEFTDGWMCPLFKKGERAEIANYRPITLLNTDYKVFTKALSVQLGEVAPGIVHRAQAGFVKGRQITDTTKLVRLMVSYCEKTGENGAIVSLDQEKAYDKIRHDYLLRVLSAAGLPERFVNTVRTLYQDAHTRVMINGVLSTPFQVRRGVRQGDPLSCLLFDIAIEPLSVLLRESGAIKGFSIPGLRERLIATLFADDTTVYLSEADDFATLEGVLELWCRAAGAKFNVAKTECIPVGTADFRKKFKEDRRAAPGHMRLPDTVRIAGEGETIRILGVWAGNDARDDDTWEKVFKKVSDQLVLWDARHPTMEGRRRLIQAYVGGGTQYLTAAQGMPPEVLKRFEKLEIDFMWQFKRTHPVNKETLLLNRMVGGAGILDLAARNDAVYVTWAREWMRTDAERPVWAYVADEVLKRSLPLVWQDRCGNSPQVLKNFILQSWKPLERVRQAGEDEKRRKNMQAAQVPLELAMMVRAAQRCELECTGTYISEEARLAAPVWYHAQHDTAFRQHHSGKAVECLREIHGVVTVRDAVECFEVIDEQGELGPAHTQGNGCECIHCDYHRSMGCAHPHSCQAVALDLVSSLREAWRPGWGNYDRGNELSPAERAANAKAEEYRHPIAFDPAVPEPARPERYARVFVRQLTVAPERGEPPRGEGLGWHEETTRAGDVIEVACHGMARAHGKRNAKATYGIWCEAEGLQLSRRLDSEDPQTRERAATLAVLEAARLLPRDRPVVIKTNVGRTVTRLTNAKEKMEAAGWTLAQENADVYRAAVAMLRSRSARTMIQLVPAEDEDVGMAEAQGLADGAQEEEAARAPRATAPAAFDLPGIPLEHVTQKMVTRVIQAGTAERTAPRRATLANIETARASVKGLVGYEPSTEELWRGVHHQDISRRARNFLWLSMHGAHRCGEFLAKWGGVWTFRAECQACADGSLETLEHVLFRCSDHTARRMWALAQAMWEDTGRKWRQPDMGLVLGCGSVGGVTDRKRRSGKWRLLRILVSETARLIWNMRCTRSVEHGDDASWSFPAATVDAAWWEMIDGRFISDRLLTNGRVYGRRALKRRLVLSTWSNTFDLSAFPDDWIDSPGVLVGRRRPHRG